MSYKHQRGNVVIKDMKGLVALCILIICICTNGFAQSSSGLIVKIIRMDKDSTLSVGQGLAFLQIGKELNLIQADSTSAVVYESCDIYDNDKKQILGRRKPKSCFEIKANSEIYFFELYPSKCSSCMVGAGYGLFSEMVLDTPESVLLANCKETRILIDKNRITAFFENLLKQGRLL